MKIEFEVPDFVDEFTISYHKTKGGRLELRVNKSDAILKEARMITPIGLKLGMLPYLVSHAVNNLKENILNNEVL